MTGVQTCALPILTSADTTPEDFNAVRDALLEKGYEFVSADVKIGRASCRERVSTRV